MDWVAIGVWITGIGVLVTAFVGLMPLLIRYLDHRLVQNEAEFSIEDSNWLAERGFTYEELLGLLLGVDYSALVELTGATAGDAKTKAPIFSKSTDTWSLVVAGGRHIAGYWSCFSMKDIAVEKIRAGVWKDSEMRDDGIRTLDEPGPHILYFEMFGIHKTYQENRAAVRHLLLRSLAEFAVRLSESGIKVSAVLANGFTKEGEERCRKLGLHPIVTSIQGGYVFESTDIEALTRRLLHLTKSKRRLLESRT